MKKSILIITLFLVALTLTPALAQAPEGKEYIVQAGDSLSAIARAEYGDPQAFQAIVAATNAKAAEDDSFVLIDNPAAIVVGQKLWLPADPNLEGLSTPAPAPAPAPGERVTAAIELTTNPWLWVSFTDPVQQFDLDDPDAYTITFNTDGTVNVKADCNNATGTYTADDSGTLSIELGPMTLAACPPQSRSDEFVQNLGFVRNFFFENGFLYLDMMADGGTFQLASAPESLPPAAPLSIDALKNATYSGIYDDEGPITLTDALYEGEPFVEGGASRPRVEYINGSERFGDLDGDGVEDAIVFLVENSGGSGNFVYVAAQLNQNGQPVDAGAVWIEDRIQVKSAVIENGQVMLEIITEGPGDAACCKSHKAHRTYALQNGQLAEIAGEEGDLERISAADLNGTTWTLLELNDEQPVLPDIDVTLSFQEGQISGSGGCNNYNSRFSLAEDNPSVMQIGPVVATKKACPEPVLNQESTYLAALENVSQWYYQVGRLALFYANEDGTTGSLIFEPQTAAEAETAPESAPGGFGTAWETVVCDTFALAADVAALADCGYVTVPEFHSQPDGPTIQVAVVRLRSTGENPAPDPLFMEQGGPGGSSVEIFPTATSYPNMQTLLNSRDLIFVEQRGALYSRPSMLCPEQTPHDVAVAQGLEDEHDLTYIQACHDRLLAEGVNLDAFNSVENAADLYFVAETLGYDSFNYYGVSYGTLLGQYVIAQAEEHPVQLRSVIIDAVVAPDVDFNAISGTTGSYALPNLFAECAQDETCSQDFPNLENVFLSLVDQLNEQPAPITLTVSEKVREAVPDAPETIETTLDGEDLVDVVFQNLYSTEAGQLLPRNIYSTIQNNNFTWIEEALSRELDPTTVARAMYFTMLCSRQNSLVNEGAFFGEPYAQLEPNNNNQDFVQGCEIMTVTPENPDPFAYDNTDIPTLILNGTHDPITPRPYGEYVGSKLENAYVYTFPGLGHGAMLTAESCPGDISISFMADPGQTPDSSCLSQVQPVFLSYPTPLAELTLEARTLDNGVTIALPSQWALNPIQENKLMSTDIGMTAGKTPSDYRVKPTLAAALIVVVIYTIYLYTMQYFSGVPYTDIKTSAETMTRFVLVPVGGGAVLLALFAIYSGWWPDLWHDKYMLDKPAWLGLFAVIMIMVIVLNFASGNIFSNSATYLLVTAVAMACVGFSEEILFRGIVLRGARGSGYRETKVMLIVAVTFGVWHAANIFLGSPVVGVVIQVILASMSGGALYMIFRKSGLLIVPMILHAFIDFSALTKGAATLTPLQERFGQISFFLPVLYLILLVAARNYIDVKQDSKMN